MPCLNGFSDFVLKESRGFASMNCLVKIPKILGTHMMSSLNLGKIIGSGVLVYSLIGIQPLWAGTGKLTDQWNKDFENSPPLTDEFLSNIKQMLCNSKFENHGKKEEMGMTLVTFTSDNGGRYLMKINAALPGTGEEQGQYVPIGKSKTLKLEKVISAEMNGLTLKFDTSLDLSEKDHAKLLGGSAILEIRKSSLSQNNMKRVIMRNVIKSKEDNGPEIKKVIFQNCLESTQISDFRSDIESDDQSESESDSDSDSSGIHSSDEPLSA